MPPGGSVEGGKGFVEQKKLRTPDDRPRKGYPLLLPAGYLARSPSLQSTKPEPFERFADPPPALRMGDPSESVGDILPDR